MRLALLATAALSGSLWCAAPAHADHGWAAAANSPSREATDWSWSRNTSSFAAEAQALDKCAQRNNATDCQILASGPGCVAIAWDVDEPLNHAHGGVGDTPQEAINAAVAAAGIDANDPSARCSWNPYPTL
jgi:hypothetical protein